MLVPGASTIDDGQGSLLLQHAEVTNGEFRAFVAATGYTRDAIDFLAHWRRPDGTLPAPAAPPVGLEDHPVVNVNLFDAEAFAEWIGMRIPTQSEWEAAASYGTTGEYPFGFYRPLCANTMELGLDHTTPVGMFENGRSVLGAYDLAGNVGEWTLGEKTPVIKGGSFRNVARPIRLPEDREQLVASRFQGDDVGFRCIQDTLPFLAARILDGPASSESIAASFRGLVRRGGEPARRVLEALATSRPGARGTIQAALGGER